MEHLYPRNSNDKVQSFLLLIDDEIKVSMTTFYWITEYFTMMQFTVKFSRLIRYSEGPVSVSVEWAYHSLSERPDILIACPLSKPSQH